MAFTNNGNQTILSRQQYGEEFTARKLAQAHDVRLFRFFDGDELCTAIYADFTDDTVAVDNYTTDPVKTAFGNNLFPDWADFLAFLEDRCIPRHRAGLREYLDVIHVSEYDPLEITQKTGGRMAEDNQWLEIKGLV